MKKKFAKITAVLLAIIQLATYTVFAEDNDFEENFLAHLGIIEMDDNYDSTAPISRIDFVKILLRAEGIDADKIILSNKQPFFDITAQDEFFNTANVAYDIGLIKGGTDGCFRPYSMISQDEALTIILRAIGNDEIIEVAGGVYNLAKRLGLYKNINVNGNAVCAYKDAAILIYNAMTASAVEKTSNGSYKINDDSTILGELFGIKYVTGILDGNCVASLYDEEPTEYNSITIDGVLYKLKSENYNDLYFAHRVTVYYTEDYSGDKIAFYITEEKNNVLELDFEDVISLNSSELTYVNSVNDKSIKKQISKTCITIHNNSRINITDNFDAERDGKIIGIDNDDDGTIDVLNITTYDIFLVKNVSVTYNRISFENSDTVIDLNDYNDFKIIDTDGKTLDISEIAQYDVAEISISPDNGCIAITVVKAQVSFAVSQISKKDNENFCIIKSDGGNEYRAVKEIYEKINVGMTYTFALDSKGNIFAKVQEDDAALYKLGYVMSTALRDSGVSVKGMVKLMGADEKVYTLEIPEKVRCLNYGSKISYDKAIDAISVSQIIRFSQNDGVMSSFEFASTDENYDGLFKIAALANSNSVDTQYFKTAALIGGRIPVNGDTVIIMPPTGTESPTDEKSYNFATIDNLANEQYYPTATGYRVGHSDVYADVVVVSGDTESVTKDSPIMLIESISENYNTDTDTTYILVKGLVSNNVKEFALNDTELLTYTTVDGKSVELGVGDCIRYVVNQKNEISKLKLMFDYSEMKMYGIDDGDDLSYSYGSRQLHRTGHVAAVYGNYVKLIPDGVNVQEDYLYSLNSSGLYQVSEINGRIVCETIKASDIISFKNDPQLKDKVFTMMVYGNTKVFVVYKGEKN